MPSIVIFAAIFVACALPAVASVPKPREVWYDTTLDHFNFQVQPARFKARYLVVDKFWTHSFDDGAKGSTDVGPILFYCGNEGSIDQFWENSGFLFDIAPQFNALVVFAEHRYYGKSLPFGEKDSFTRTGLAYNTVLQAMADYANLLTTLSKQLQAQHAPVIAAGGSYGGMLAFYMRSKYPFIVDMALASSAPIRLVGPDVDYRYFAYLTEVFGRARSDCPSLVRSAFTEAAQLASTGAAGLATLTKNFRLCSPLKQQSDVDHLFMWVVNSFTGTAMCNYPYPTGFLAPLPAWPVTVACDIMRGSGALSARLGAAAGLFYNGTGKLTCFNTSDLVECHDPTGCGKDADSIAWDYQSCTQFQFYGSMNNVTDMFPPHVFNMQKGQEYCRRQYGIVSNPNWHNIQFGPYDLRAVSNVIFANGRLDPFYAGGVVTNVSDTVVALIVEQGAHHLDLRASHPADPQSVIDVRKQIVNLFKKWLPQARLDRAARLSAVETKREL